MITKKSNHLARLEEFFLLKEFEQANKKYETNPEFRAEVDEACASFIKNRHAEEQQVIASKIRESEKHHGLAKIENLRNYLQKLTDISEDCARELANLSDHTISDYRNVAESAPVCEMGTANWESFQLPLGIYFREIVSLSEDLAKPWAGAALLFQRNTNGLRLLLQSAPDNLALAVSIDSNREITLDNFRGAATIPYDVGKIGQLRIGIFPFRTD